MTKILLLTKNMEHEAPFEQQLRLLGHEVFTSVSLFEGILHDQLPQNFSSMFQQVIISETIDNRETDLLMNKLKGQMLVLLRKTDKRVGVPTSAEWREQGLIGWVSCQSTLEELREQLVKHRTEQMEKIYYYQSVKEVVDISMLRLSAGEKKLLMILYKQQKRFISREELCMEIWGRNKSNSTMSQLSAMVRKLKEKFLRMNLEGEIIETSWGKGYRLHELAYQQINFDSPKESLVQ